ncbi:poly(U)-specific 3'-to-5' RNA exonuclease [Bulinus truncatus]|nr:poly(U)-specific 3'-to-5' RNA exonuclease [Bulinus truncatus]
MNRLVSYSESSDDDESRLSSPDKINNTASPRDLCSSTGSTNKVKDVNATCHQDQNELILDNQNNAHTKLYNVSECEKEQIKRSNTSSHAIIKIESAYNMPNCYSSNLNTAAVADEPKSHQFNVSDESHHLLSHDKGSYSLTISHEVNTKSSSEFPKSKVSFHESSKQCNNCCFINIESNVNHFESNTEYLFHTKLSEQTKINDIVPRSIPTTLSENENIPQTSRKRKYSNHNNNSVDKSDLLLPDTLKRMFPDHRHKCIDNPAEHDNRIRSFPHLEGNWAAHIFFPVRQDERFQEFVHSVIQIFEPLEFKAFPEFHISLSRTVAIRHHWIEPLVTSLREQLKTLKSGLSDMTAIKLFANDEKTRTFICIELSQEDTEFMQYVTAVDKCLLEFKLPVYYENPSFHISIGWCLGNVIEDVSEDKLITSKEMLSNFIAENPDLSTLLLQQVYCRAGNKMFAITLED